MDELRHRPKHRSKLHMMAGKAYFSAMRYLQWRCSGPYAKKRGALMLPEIQFRHATPLLRQLSGLELQLQYNKVTNLRLACAQLDGLILKPGETFSYWKTIGKPTVRKGYLPGMILVSGKVEAGVGGGLCQLSNLIYWMALHTPLTVTERHHHGYDVFPDSNRTQPFGSGATCFYPYGDLMIRNDTDQEFQLHVQVQDENLFGEWRSTCKPVQQYRIVERNHYIRGEYWGGFTRHNELWRQVFDWDGTDYGEEFVSENHVLMMYAPFLEDGHSNKDV
ncbi:MAG: vancomycin resistance protein [Oscillospiraceae bacterium]|nr:vancomycin resistance protein [Oscillospiraceae bacterium]